jgi:hypothetical protein
MTTHDRIMTDWRLHAALSAMAVLYRRAEVVELAGKPTVGDAIATGPGWVRHEIDSMLAEAYARFPDEPEAPDDGDAAHEPVTEGAGDR